MDLRYARARSPGHDLKLLLKTVLVVLFGRGS
jgi:lipopolysaccharide/colanic/teichoic acid biosynthesis glycosyltransferase